MQTSEDPLAITVREGLLIIGLLKRRKEALDSAMCSICATFSLLQDHIQEVLDKWHQIDDEIWAKVIVLERNRRVAKAYARAPVLTINGSDDGFDGFRYIDRKPISVITRRRCLLSRRRRISASRWPCGNRINLFFNNVKKMRARVRRRFPFYEINALPMYSFSERNVRKGKR